MEQLIELAIVFALGWFLGSRFTSIMHLMSFKSVLKDLGITNEQLRNIARKNNMVLPEDNIDNTQSGLEEIHIKLEQHQGQIYAFRKDNDAFLGQGTDRDSLIDHLKQRMTNVRLIIDEGGELLQKNNT